MKKLFCLALLGATLLAVSSAQSIGSYHLEGVLTHVVRGPLGMTVDCHYDMYRVSGNSRVYDGKKVITKGVSGTWAPSCPQTI